MAPLFTQLVGDWFSAPRTEISGFVSGGHTGAGGGSAWLDEEGNQVSISYSYLWLLNTGETPVSVTGIDLPARYAMGDARYCADRHGSLQPGQSQLVLLVRGGSDSSGLSDADGPLTAYTPEKLVIELSNERDAAFSLVPSNFEVSEVLDQCGQLEAAPSSGSAG